MCIWSMWQFTLGGFERVCRVSFQQDSAMLHCLAAEALCHPTQPGFLPLQDL